MGTLRKWLFDLANTTPLSTVNVKDTTGTLSASQVSVGGAGSATSSTDHPYPGATSAKFVAVTGQQSLARLPLDAANASMAFSVGFWYSGTAPTTAALNFYNGRASGGVNIKLAISTTGKLLLQDSAGTGQFQSTATLTAGFYRVDAYATWGATNTGTGRIQYCLADSATVAESSAVLTGKAFGTANFAAGDVGVIDTTATARTVYVTSVQMEDGRTSFIGPLVTGSTGTAAQTLGPITQSVAGTHTGPSFTGTAVQTLGRVGQSAAGTRTVPSFTATASQNLTRVTTAATGTRTNPPGTAGLIGQTLARVGQSLAGTRTIPIRTGSGAQTLPHLAQTGSGTQTAPLSAGTATQTLRPVTQSVVGTHTRPITGGINVALPRLAQSATGTRTAPALVVGEDPRLLFTEIPPSVVLTEYTHPTATLTGPMPARLSFHAYP